MFQGSTRSLDEMVSGGEDENISFVDTVPAETDVEEDAVEKLAVVHIREE